MSSWLSSTLGFGANGSTNPNDSDLATDPRALLSRFSDRLKHATLAQDRRASLLSIKGLSRDYKSLVLECALDGLTSSLHRDIHDSAMVTIIIETLLVIFTVHPKKPEEQGLVTHATNNFTHSPANVAVILDLLVEDDFHLRFDALQLLATLHKLHPHQVVSGVLSNPTGVPKLMDLLHETREAIRTEAVLFLNSLTQFNTEVQKVVAFESAFDTLFDLLQNDDTLDPATGLDCLTLALNLIRLNPSNQNLFRESGGIPKLTACLERYLPVDEPSSDTEELAAQSPGNASHHPRMTGALSRPDPYHWTNEQKSACVALLCIIRALVVPNAASSIPAQEALAHANVLGVLLELGLASGVPLPVKTLALFALGDVVRGNVSHRASLADSVVYVPVGDEGVARKSALMLVIGIAVLGVDEGERNNDEDIELRRAALYALQSYVANFPDGQHGLSMTVVNPPPDEIGGTNPQGVSDHPLSNSIVLQPLIDWQIRDPERVWFASMVTASLVVGNDRAKETMSGMYSQQMQRSKRIFDKSRRQSAADSLGETSVPDDLDEDDFVTLVQSIGHTLVFSSRGNASVQTQVALLSVLCCWVWEYPPSVGEIIGDSTILQFLIEHALSNTGDVLVEGLTSYLLATCYEHYPSQLSESSTPSSMTHNQLYSVLNTRIGTDQLQVKLTRFREDSRFVDWRRSGLFLDEVIVAHINDTAGELMRGIRLSPEAKVKSAHDLEQRSSKVYHLESRVQELGSLLESRARVYESKLRELQEENERLTSQLHTAQANLASVEKEHNSLLVCLAEQDLDMKRLRNQVRSIGSKESLVGTDSGSLQTIILPSPRLGTSTPNKSRSSLSRSPSPKKDKILLPSNPSPLSDVTVPTGPMVDPLLTDNEALTMPDKTPKTGQPSLSSLSLMQSSIEGQNQMSGRSQEPLSRSVLKKPEFKSKDEYAVKEADQSRPPFQVEAVAGSSGVQPEQDSSVMDL